ncbi:GNAT family N-acetyltransferase [bacterium]|nr:GNAT family N-acetyltransferase [bacterium]
MLQLNKSVFDRFPEIKTNRLTLREITPNDAREIYEIRKNSRVNQFIARPEMDTLTSAEKLAEQTQKAFYDQKAIGFAGVLRDKQKLIGSCGFNRIDFNNLRAEIGGELKPEYWGKGIAAEAFGAIINFGFTQLQLQAVEAWVQPLNRGATHLLTANGFEKEGHFKDYIYFNRQFIDIVVYVLHRKNFNAFSHINS